MFVRDKAPEGSKSFENVCAQDHSSHCSVCLPKCLPRAHHLFPQVQLRKIIGQHEYFKGIESIVECCRIHARLHASLFFGVHISLSLGTILTSTGKSRAFRVWTYLFV